MFKVKVFLETAKGCELKSRAGESCEERVASLRRLLLAKHESRCGERQDVGVCFLRGNVGRSHFDGCFEGVGNESVGISGEFRGGERKWEGRKKEEWENGFLLIPS